MRTVVVIGGGITGLSTAYYLQKHILRNNLDVNIVLVEANNRLGGKVRTLHEGEFTMESGADSIVTRKTNVAPLIEELGLQDEVVYNATGTSFIYTEGKLKQIPKDSVFGIPLTIESLANSELISAEGKVEALKDFYTPNDKFTKDDSVGDFLEAFFGKELVEKQISPVLSGVYSGNLDDLTIASTLPYLIDYKNEYGSIIQGLSANKLKFQGNGDKKFMSFKGGVSALIDAMEEHLSDAEIIKGIYAERIEKQGDQYQVTLVNGRTLEADTVVLSTMHNTAQALLQDESLNEDFNQLVNSSLISVYLGFDIPDSQLPADGTGFITANSDDVKCHACTWTSRKWGHTSEHQRLLVRLFYKSSGPHYDTLIKLSEEELQQVALQDIQISLGITANPITYDVTKWHNTMPNYHIRHHQIVESLEQKMASHYPNVILAGCSYYGVGIPDCIANGEKTAGIIMEQMISNSI
ncbi:protoporphyrinogen oxidase [Paenibacillus macquariensis]|uniref:Coproporphyrinogen III oxidase n=1 Tax=Paenibacillus macquariensis TaxID=948756 RepID=A0ABY1JP85_9BACL|nr:protoporphyrinogen oxidase [Paenibacillus macquariensis]MEC0092015.1 protoporphyrinogen oxidase [Paenibacillus macquariensis]OAB37578.1 protoporphyrinogen oxidase [Paenibacillus macquariensis subsp. macquariensis]SIQ52672.1 oxygen-dependent protoporphyrinogen oxidase [Paenibacillus macquariensis]